ncbi:MAG: hypothetical protein JWR83_2231 [Aeromicrobium sp.]|nr:hypothetical protein [Aeromicrobium sp.]
MKRIVTWLLSTLTVLVLLFGYHTSTSKSFDGNSVIATPVRGSASPAPSSAPTTSPSASPSPSPSSGSTKASSPSTVTGPSVDTQWGPVQVAITVAAGKITAVSVPVYPSGNGRDAQINSYALPILIDETIKAQTAGIDMVSGATVSSRGYLQSLQGAIDQANL